MPPHIALISLAASLLMLTACAEAPFGYAKDRCLGAQNQCRNACIGIDNGPAQAACYAQCQDRQQQCYTVGDDGRGSSLSQERMIGDTRAETDKQADYERWKAQKEKEKQNTEETSDGDGSADTED